MIPLLLAETAPSAQALKDWLGVAFFLLGGAVATKKLFFDKQPQPTPQPLMVKNAADFVTTATHEKSISEIRAELLRHAGRRAEIYETQKTQSAQLAALDEKTELMNAQLQRQDGKIDRILERLPRQ